MEEKINFSCPICGNSDPTYIGVRNNHPYCRKCISFRGKEADEPISAPKNADYKPNYRLSKE